MQNWVLSKHALTVIAERRIEPAWIQLALEHPDAVVRDAADTRLEHALRRIPDADDRVLRVIYNMRTSPAVIVTAFFDRRERRRREDHL